MIDLIEWSWETMRDKYLKESMHEHIDLSLSFPHCQLNGDNIKQSKICLKHNTSESPRPFLFATLLSFVLFLFSFSSFFGSTFNCLANAIYIRLIIINVLKYSTSAGIQAGGRSAKHSTAHCWVWIVVRSLSNASHKMMIFQSIEWP